MDEIRLTLPLPAKPLQPNARAHWASKAKEVRRAREAARWQSVQYCLAHRALKGPARPHWPSANVQITLYAKDRRRRDADNVLASCKAYFDGIADAGVVENDAGMVHHPVLMEHDPANPRIEIRIWPS